ncbi:MAG: ABC transporter ATP-binding protein [Alphaproteobacteria bacterium HGW-Alphaproteobacteria-4]|jgi:iron complex transport system ATP-binding protein|nr:MAG: ABC transporter ATP-binding protein [Alphaproteobacteria bacterium HGW-Alphaproteobacteria-4]
MSGLTLERVSVRRGRVLVLQELSVRLPPGGIVGVVGPNGAGKSTLLLAVAGLLAHGGAVRWQGAPLGGRDIGFLPQAFAVRANLSVLECVLLGRREALGWRVAETEVTGAEAMLERFGLSHLAARPMTALSGGQQQLVLLAQRLLRNPRVLVLDEPTSALDLHHQLDVLRHLQRHARATGGLVLTALHDLTLAARFCDGLLLLAGGALVGQGTPAEVLTENRVGETYRISPEILQARDHCPVIVPH